MPGLPVISGYDLAAALKRAGFEQARQKGSYARLKHADGRVVTFPIHVGQEIGKGLLSKILRDAEWPVEDLKAYLQK